MTGLWRGTGEHAVSSSTATINTGEPMTASYDAFISYSHAADGKLASALGAELQRFGKPWYKRRSLNLFRNQTSLSATPALWAAIEQALQSSRYFLLLASPEAAASPWVQKEIAWWLEHKPLQTLLIALTRGNIRWDLVVGDFDWDATDLLPPNLKGVFTEEPLWVDLRWVSDEKNLSLRNPRFLDAVADLAAPLLGHPKEDTLNAHVRRTGDDREQWRRREAEQLQGESMMSKNGRRSLFKRGRR